MRNGFLLSFLACAAAAGAQTNTPAQTGTVAQTNTAVQSSMPSVQTNLPPQQTIDIDGYAAKVNDQVITIGDVREAMAPILPELYRTYQGAQLDRALEQAFQETRDALVEQALILAAFKKQGGQIPDQYVNDEIRRIINERFKGDEAQFEQGLAAAKKSRADYAETVRDQMIVGMMINEEITQRARVTPEEVRSYYDEHREQLYAIPEQVKYSVIVLNKGESPEEQEVKLAEAANIRQKLLDGADFAETAKAVSEGSRAADGGLFPWMQPDEVRAELRETLQSLPAGEISEIIDTGTQLYLVKVEARRQAGYKGFDEVREEIRTELLTKEKERLRARWINRLMSENYVKIYED
jgi:parvulin-like peptidyl-prolyl isomerase